MFETMKIGDINKIYIMYVAFKRKPKQVKWLNYIRELVVANDMYHPEKTQPVISHGRLAAKRSTKVHIVLNVFSKDTRCLP